MPTPKKVVAKKVPAKKAVSSSKTATKKVTQKKAVVTKPKKVAATAKPLVVADDARSFWVADGRILNSLLALQTALAEMEEAVYVHHANQEKNDFALWVDNVLCDQACATELAKAKTPHAARTVVVKHLKTYKI